MTNNLDTLSLDNLINPNLLNDEPVIVIIPPGSQTDIFLKYSTDYQLKRRKIKTAGQVHKPIISDHYNSRAQIDLVDMSSLPDNSHDPPYRYIFNCQDHLTKFCHLRPCTTKGAVEVANHLYHIFCRGGKIKRKRGGTNINK